MTETSLKGGYDKKADWKKYFGNKENKDARHAVLEAIDVTQAKHGRHRVEQRHYNIDDYLIGDKSRLKEEILNFLNEMSHDNDIAYLWKVLDETRHLKDVSFPDFHRALEGLWGRDIKYDRAQRLFTKLTVDRKEFAVAANRAAREGRALICKWVKVFEVIPL